VQSEEGIAAAVASLGGYEAGLYAEKWVPFVCELAVMVVRSRDGTLASFPVVQTIHKDSICWTTETPARVPQAAQRAAQAVAEQAVAALEGALGVEGGAAGAARACRHPGRARCRAAHACIAVACRAAR
jgi:phosphoribosylaminoimidazole carboxylase